MDKLTELANKYSSDKGTVAPLKGHHGPRLHFTPIYYENVKKWENETINLLEIGIGSGPSLKMWYDYFPFANIYAIDIVNCSQYNNDRVSTFVGDQSNRDDLCKIVNKIGRKFHIVIDDGGHMMKQQQVSLACIFPHLMSGGLYFIEDLHTSYWPYNGFENLYGSKLDINQDRSNTTAKMVQDYIDTNTFYSHFMDNKEMAYLNGNIKKCELFNLPKTIYGPNQLAMMEKK